MSAAPVRSRRRRWARRGGAGLAVLALAGGVLLAWLLSTAGGRDTLLGRVVGLLPPGALTWSRAEGTVNGPLVLHDVRYRRDGVEFTARRVLLDPDLLPVLGRRLQLDRLEVDEAVLALPPADDEPFALPEWPGSLPRVPMPFDLRATRLQVRDFAIRRDDDALLRIASADGTRLQLVDDGFRGETLRLATDLGTATLRGEYLPDRGHRMDLVATLRRAATADAPALALQLTAEGDAGDLAVELAGTAPGRVAATLSLRDDAGIPAWTLQADADAIDPALFSPERAAGEPWRGTLRASGRGGAGTLAGDAVIDGVAIGLAPSAMSIADGVLTAAPLRIELAQGVVDVTGTLDVRGDAPAFDAVVRSDALRLEPATDEEGAQPVVAGGELRVRGHVDAWTLDGDATLRRGDERARLALAGRGDRQSLAIDSLRAVTPDGELAGRGEARWAPQLAFALDARLAGFDPGYFLPDYPGAVAGTLVATGRRDDAGRWRGEARLDALDGTLRGRALSGFVHGEWANEHGRVDADLGLGDSRVAIEGEVGERLDLHARFAPLQLADVVAGGSGRIDGTLSLRGPREAFDLSAQLRAAGLRWGDDRVGTLALHGDLPARAGAGTLQADATGVVVGGFAFDRVSATATGRQSDLRLRVDADGDSDLAATATLARAGTAWRGQLQSLAVVPARGPRLVLEDAFAFRLDGDATTFDRACLRVDGGRGRACAVADGRRLLVDADAVPLALLQPWLPADTALPLATYGEVAADAELRRRGDGWSGTATLRSASGGLRLADDVDRALFAYRDLEADLSLAGSQVELRLDAGLAAGGRVAATLRTGTAAGAPLDGRLQLDVRDLTWLELFSEDLAAPRGMLAGTLAIAGTRADPALSGTATLAGFAAELPALGLRLTEGAFELVGRDDGAVRVTGRVRSGDGVLALDGSLDLGADDAPLVLALDGDDVTLANTPELQVIADPDLVLRWLPDRLEVRGTLAVPTASVDLESLDSSVPVSPDVVVVDPVEAPGEQPRARPLDLQLAVSLGDDVRLEGFGLDGRMTGAVTLRERPGRRATATGALQVTGAYRAYGQSLAIERARLGFASSPYDDPTLDIRAEREFDDVTVGVQVRGTARRPETTIVSTPAMDTSEALSWLVFGRPLHTTTAGESERLGAAALALGAGSNLVAQQIGARLGLDEAGVVDSRNLGGATLTVGKYVSPRLFLSYGVSLIGTGQVVTLKYLLSRNFDISVESGNENAASVNWRTER